MTTYEIFQWIIQLLGAISPVAIAVLTGVMKKDAKVRKLEAQIQAEKEQEKEDRINKMNEQLNDLVEEIKKLRDEADISKIESQFKQLRYLNEFNFGYIQNLSKVVISIGDAIINSDIVTDDESLKKSITTFKANEVNLMKDLYKIIS